MPAALSEPRASLRASRVQGLGSIEGAGPLHDYRPEFGNDNATSLRRDEAGTMSEPAVLALADGSLFNGRSIGAAGQSAGEVVFNTAMTGYQEILSDPSYAGQLVTLTTAHVGNTGINEEDMESARLQAAGLIVRDCPASWSNWRGQWDLPGYLATREVIAIADIDTRRLTRRLRERGAMPGCIVAGEQACAEAALAGASACPAMQGRDLARSVSCAEAYDWTTGSGRWGMGETGSHPRRPWHVVAYDFGIKFNILRLLVDYGCRVTVVPATTPAEVVLERSPDGVFLSNGPGDPEPCDYAIESVRQLLDSGVPLFGICLGHQLLGLACGARSTKMKFGHHGANHPVVEIETGRVAITSQNHGFAIDEDSLPASLRATHRSLFDGSLQGVTHTERPAFGFQGHPEASPGPHDMRGLFERFTAVMAERQGASR